MEVTRDFESLDHDNVATVSVSAKCCRVQPHGFVLELCSECGELSEALRCSNLATCEIEILRGSKLDISDRLVQLLVPR